MRFSLRSEYALLSLSYLARQPEAPNTSAVIGTSQQIPSEILREILISLVNARYLRLAKGIIYLAKPAERISVAEILLLFDGHHPTLLESASKNGDQPIQIKKEEKLSGLFSQLQKLIIDELKKTSLADLL